MNFRTTYILFGAVAILLVVFLLMLAFGPSGDADEYVLRSLHESVTRDKLADAKKEFDRLEIERIQPSGETLVFVRTGEGWKLEAPYEARIDKDQIERIIGDLVDARIDRKADITHKLEALGLDSPGVYVTLRKGKASYRLALGNMAGGSRSIVFATAADRGKEPIAIPKSSLDGLFKLGGVVTNPITAGEALKGVTDYRPRSLLADGSPVPWDTVQRVTLKEGDKRVVLQKAEDNSWRFQEPADYGPADLEGEPGGPAAENLAGVKPLLTALAGLRLPDSADIIENPPRLEEHGLAAGSETFRVEFLLKSGATETLLFGKKTDKDEKIFARRDGEVCVVKLPTKAIEPIRKVVSSPVVMRDRNLTSIVPSAVDAIDITIRGEKKFELRKFGVPAQWRLYEVGSESFEMASFATITQLLNRLSERRQVKEFPDSSKGDAAYGLDDPAVELAIWQDGIVPEKKDDPPADPMKKDEPKKPTPIKKPELKGLATVKLRFGKKEKDLVYVRRIVGPVSTLVAIADSTLPIVAKGQVDYLDLLLPSFDRTKVTKVAFNRGPEKFELEKEGGNPASFTWKFVLPADRVGRTANAVLAEQALTAFQMITAVKIVTAKATDADLERFGLKSPKVEVAITQKDAPDKLIYQFGNETEDKQHLYARVAGKTQVFHVRKDTLDAIEQGELHDLTVFRLDPKLVRSFKMTGWKDIALNPVTVEFSRKETAWMVKPDDKDLVPAKVEQFLQLLSLVRAERFVTLKGTPTPDQKLDVAAGALTIEIVVEGEKDPIQLTIGGLEKDGKTRFTVCNRAPGAIFLVFKERFEEVSKPTWFRK